MYPEKTQLYSSSPPKLDTMVGMAVETIRASRAPRKTASRAAVTIITRVWKEMAVSTTRTPV
jgi:hypothetical protein